jgi:hypothetical protein
VSAMPIWAKATATAVMALGTAAACLACWAALDSRGLRHALRICDELCDRCEERRRLGRINSGADSARQYRAGGESR